MFYLFCYDLELVFKFFWVIFEGFLMLRWVVNDMVEFFVKWCLLFCLSKKIMYEFVEMICYILWICILYMFEFI